MVNSWHWRRSKGLDRMESVMILSYNDNVVTCTKTSLKILHVQKGEKHENAPGKARKRQNRVRFGCWRRWERLGTRENGWESQVTEPECTPIPIQHVQKENRRKPSVFAGFVAGAEGLVSAAAAVSAGRHRRPAPHDTHRRRACGRTSLPNPTVR